MDLVPGTLRVAPATRLHEVDVAKGIAIFLVVVGHIVLSNHLPKDADWYLWIQKAVYRFHMPFFMFLSGFVIGYNYFPIENLPQYCAFVWKKFVRLFPAYAMVGTLILIGKIGAARFVHVDNVPTEFIGGAIDILTRPDESVARGLWYVYTLFQLAAVYPLLQLVFKNYVFVAGMLTLPLSSAFGFTESFGLHQFAEYLPFFLIGAGMHRHWLQFTKFARLFWAIWVSSLIVLLVAASLWPVPKYVTGLASAPALIGLALVVRSGKISRVLILLGSYSFTIYLFNTIFIGSAKAVMLFVMPWEGIYFAAMSPILLGAGILGPLFLKRQVFSRIPLLDRITK
jgi:fucose 4-O-acetylase-like acetyltransferase